MQKRILFIVLILVVGLVFLFYRQQTTVPKKNASQTNEIISGVFDKSKFKTNEEWKKILTSEQYHIVREAGTEIAFTGVLNNEKRKGTYYSVGCDQPVFRSEQKYESETGWPSFYAPISPNALVLQRDRGFPGEARIEVLDKCGGHLGHVFDDGPEPTGKRYCMNSAALRFVPDETQ